MAFVIRDLLLVHCCRSWFVCVFLWLQVSWKVVNVIRPVIIAVLAMFCKWCGNRRPWFVVGALLFVNRMCLVVAGVTKVDLQLVQGHHLINFLGICFCQPMRPGSGARIQPRQGCGSDLFRVCLPMPKRESNQKLGRQTWESNQKVGR